MNRTVIAVLLGLCLLAGLGRFIWLGREQPIDLPPVASLACASYAPFRGAETPYDPTFVVSPERVAEDLAALKPLTNCVRTYSTFTGLEVVPAEAEKLGMQVMLGAWIGRDTVQNRRELDRAVELANAYPDTVRMVIVGNEVLLRREQPEAAIAAMLRETKARLPAGVDITYADVWEFWVRAPSLVPLVDVVTVHILPYWEDHPIGIDHAVDHVEAIHDDMVETFAGKPVLIGETGWPSIGRQREAAEPSQANQALFLRSLALRATEHGWDYNIVEAFDQPWKRKQEGTVGGAWGLIDTHRNAKPVLGGAVVEVPSWRLWLAGAVGLGLLPVAAAFAARRQIDPMGRMILILGGVAAATALALFLHHVAVSSRNWLEWGANLIALGAAGAASFGVLMTLAETGPTRRAWISQERLAVLRGFVLAVAAIGVLALVFDARYRDFPASVILAPAIGFLALHWIGRAPAPRREDRWLALVIAAGAPWVAYKEGVTNDDALLWASAMLALSLPALFARHSARG